MRIKTHMERQLMFKKFDLAQLSNGFAFLSSRAMSRLVRRGPNCSYGFHLNWKHYLESCTAPRIRLRDDTTAVELNNHSRYRKPQSRSLIFSCNKRIKNFRRALLFEARPRILHRYSDFTLILPFSLKR